MLNVLSTNKTKAEPSLWVQEASGSDEYIYYLNCSNVLTGRLDVINMYSILYQLGLNKAIKI
jgi:hypothetical protein